MSWNVWRDHVNKKRTNTLKCFDTDGIWCVWSRRLFNSLRKRGQIVHNNHILLCPMLKFILPICPNVVFFVKDIVEAVDHKLLYLLRDQWHFIFNFNSLSISLFPHYIWHVVAIQNKTNVHEEIIKKNI